MAYRTYSPRFISRWYAIASASSRSLGPNRTLTRSVFVAIVSPLYAHRLTMSRVVRGAWGARAARRTPEMVVPSAPFAPRARLVYPGHVLPHTSHRCLSLAPRIPRINVVGWTRRQRAQ